MVPEWYFDMLNMISDLQRGFDNSVVVGNLEEITGNAYRELGFEPFGNSFVLTLDFGEFTVSNFETRSVLQLWDNLGNPSEHYETRLYAHVSFENYESLESYLNPCLSWDVVCDVVEVIDIVESELRQRGLL